ncbi:uracil-DNA glycosylase family protein [Devosia sp.]|uniref:uracil-DNA glycosylase family protein n=1 Tax=Devosia sp. TaxID=1871048 RepID=UPI002AFDDD84|nr:uracil-DNA glycosylase family protein [Devosia sp.]
MVQAGARAGVMIIGQAPGRKVHESGVPWDDASGERLRAWMGISRHDFYDPHKVAIMPMGFCYPGVAKGGGDAPPMRRCAPTWHGALLEKLPDIRLTLLVGSYAQAYYLSARGRSMTDTVRDFSAGDALLPLPHPSWRVVGWMRNNPWFERDILPVLKRRVAEALAG